MLVEVSPGNVEVNWPRVVNKAADINNHEDEDWNDVAPPMGLDNGLDVPLRQPSLSPLLPREQHFQAKMVHMDEKGIVWVIPSDHLRIMDKISSQISECVTCVTPLPIEKIIPGTLVTCKRKGALVRARILRVETEVVQYIDVDSGQQSVCGVQDVLRLVPSLLLQPPLAVPLKLYGVKKNTAALCSQDVGELFDFISPSPVTVSVLEPGLDQLPLPVHLRFSLSEEEDDMEVNLGLCLLKLDLVSLCVTPRDWETEWRHHNLDWLVGMAPPQPLSLLPHFLPLEEGLWLCVTVQGLQCAHDQTTGQEMDPSLNTPGANRVACHIKPLSPLLVFDRNQTEISSSARVSDVPLQQLENAFKKFKEELASSPFAALESVKTMTNVATFSEGEWCRAKVVNEERRSRNWRIYYIDYGHYGETSMESLRELSPDLMMQPVQVQDFYFSLPEDNRQLLSIRSQLYEHSCDSPHRKLLIRIENIQEEKVWVSFWRAEQREGRESCYNIVKIV